MPNKFGCVFKIKVKGRDYNKVNLNRFLQNEKLKFGWFKKRIKILKKNDQFK